MRKPVKNSPTKMPIELIREICKNHGIKFLSAVVNPRSATKSVVYEIHVKHTERQKDFEAEMFEKIKKLDIIKYIS